MGAGYTCADRARDVKGDSLDQLTSVYTRPGKSFLTPYITTNHEYSKERGQTAMNVIIKGPML